MAEYLLPSRKEQRQKRRDPSGNQGLCHALVPATCDATVPTVDPGLVKKFVSTVAAVPSVVPLSTDCACNTCFARPKSRILAWLRFVIKILAGLMSR